MEAQNRERWAVDDKAVTLKAADRQVDGWNRSARKAKMSRQAWCKAILDAELRKKEERRRAANA